MASQLDDTMAPQPQQEHSEGRLKDDGSPMFCSVCTYTNASDSLVCELCSEDDTMTPRPQQKRSEGRLKDDGSPMICSICTYINPSDTVVCEMCYTQLNIVPNDAIVCSACTFQNSSYALNCDVCGVELADSKERVAEFLGGEDRGDLSRVSESGSSESELEILMKSIHEEEEANAEIAAQQKQEEIVAMRKTATGKAWCLVNAVIELNTKLDGDFECIRQGNEDLGTIALDDMILFAERLIELQASFRSQGWPCQVTIAYHYTTEQSIESIRENGLMSGPERTTNNVEAFRNSGAYYGPGIYMANNPYAFQHFGGVGVIAAILTGRKGSRRKRRCRTTPKGVNTVVGNKTGNHRGVTSHFEDEIVLKESAQCLPMIGFSTSLIGGEEDSLLLTPASKLIWKYHQLLQYLVDGILNDGDETVPELVLSEPDTALPRIRRPLPVKVGPSSQNFIENTVDSLLCQSLVEEYPTTGVFSYTAPETLKGRWDESYGKLISEKPRDECPVCLAELTSSVFELSVCGHCFHEQCLHEVMGHQSNCPVCRSRIATPQGKSPSGSMAVIVVTHSCNGYDDCGSICIDYDMDGGTQKQYHPNPGSRFVGTERLAGLPNNSDGRKLLKRLIYAFQHGLTFSVGTSLTTGQQNTTVWASIHHKTSNDGGEHSFPDPNYFLSCNEELDALGVPPSDDCAFFQESRL